MTELPQLPLDASADVSGDPLSMPCLDRRAFLTGSALAALGTMLASACGSGFGAPTGPSSVNVTVKLSDYAGLATVGAVVRLSGTDTPIAVVTTGAATYRAFSLICPHAGATVGVSGSSFRCPQHGATFSSTGASTGGLRTSGLYEFKVASNSGAGTITITS